MVPQTKSQCTFLERTPVFLSSPVERGGQPELGRRQKMLSQCLAFPAALGTTYSISACPDLVGKGEMQLGFGTSFSPLRRAVPNMHTLNTPSALLVSQIQGHIESVNQPPSSESQVRATSASPAGAFSEVDPTRKSESLRASAPQTGTGSPGSGRRVHLGLWGGMWGPL